MIFYLHYQNRISNRIAKRRVIESDTKRILLDNFVGEKLECGE